MRDSTKRKTAAAPLVATQTSVRMTVKAIRGTGQSSETDDVDDVTKDLIAQAPAMFMAPADEKGGET